MNKKGGVAIFLYIMLAIVAIIIATIVVEPLATLITGARTDLSCSSTTISTGDRLGCIAVDLIIPLFITVVVVAGLSKIKDG